MGGLSSVSFIRLLTASGSRGKLLLLPSGQKKKDLREDEEVGRAQSLTG